MFTKLLLALLLSVSLSASSPVKISITPKVGVVPVTVRAKVTVENNPDNRTLCLVWGKSDEGFGSSSCMDLDGADAPKTIFFRDKILRESGEWFFMARLTQASGKTFAVTETIEVVGGM